MSNSFTSSDSVTFTLTHAKYLASKVKTDLKRMQRFYEGIPNDERIDKFEQELTILLNGGFVSRVMYGFKRNDQWIEPTLRYEAKDLLNFINTDDDPGRVLPGADVNGASFYSYLVFSDAWSKLSDTDRKATEEKLPFIRGGANEPSVNGYFVQDKTYSAGGRSLNRSTVKGY